MDADEQYIRRAIRLAMNGRGHVEPNPMVGCVIVKGGRVIGEGFHAKYGGPHAEPTALANCSESPAGATAYVTLEPCCHLDKQTPPCAPRLIREGIARVVIGCPDPNPKVNGKGVRLLRDAGVRVDGPVLEAECKQLIAAFLTRVTDGRPYVTLKWAESADAKVAGAGGRPVQISNPAASRLVHLLRSRSDSIVVGVNTVLTDDPMLTPRGVPALRTPERIVLDSRLRIPTTSRLATSSRQHATRVCCYTGMLGSPKADALRTAGVNVTDLDVWPDPAGRGPLSLTEFMLVDNGSHQLVEPGPTLAAGYFARNVADRVWIIRSARVVDAADAPSAATLPPEFVAVGSVDLDGNVVTEYLNTRSSAYFAPVPSADLILAGASLAQEPHLAPGEHARG